MSRRILVLVLSLILILGLSVSASAESAVTNLQNYATITSNGSCQVNLTVSLHIDTPTEGLTFPLPKEALDIRRDNESVKVNRTSSANEVSLSNLDGFTGDTVVRLTYSLENTVTVSEGKLYLNLPLLSGFQYPIQTMKFDLMLPAAISYTPQL